MVAHKDVKPPIPAPPEKVTTSALATLQSDLSTLLQRATRSASALTPRDALTLQRTVGNRAVGAVLQRKLDLEKVKAAGLDKAKLQTWAGSHLRGKELEVLVSFLTPDQLVLAVKMSPETFKGVPGRDIAGKIPTPDAVVAVAVEPKVDELTDHAIEQSLAETFFRKNGAAAVDALIASVTTAGTVDTVLLRDKIAAANSLRGGIRALNTLLTTGNPQGYAEEKILELLSTKGYDRVTEVLALTASEHNMEYVRACLSWNVSRSSPVPLRQLFRLYALLKTTPGTLLTVSQADVPYRGSTNPPSRTGFLQYAFADETIEIHTHWNETGKRVVSMHVKDGSENGLEVNRWMKEFPAVCIAVVAAHNSAGGGLAPTTNPAGGALTL